MRRQQHQHKGRKALTSRFSTYSRMVVVTYHRNITASSQMRRWSPNVLACISGLLVAINILQFLVVKEGLV